MEENLAERCKELEGKLRQAHSERNRVVSLMAAFAREHYEDQFAYGTRKEPDGREFFYMDTPVGQLSWLLEGDDRNFFSSFGAYGKEFDGHTSERKAVRITLLRAALLDGGS